MLPVQPCEIFGQAFAIGMILFLMFIMGRFFYEVFFTDLPLN